MTTRKELAASAPSRVLEARGPRRLAVAVPAPPPPRLRGGGSPPARREGARRPRTLLLLAAMRAKPAAALAAGGASAASQGGSCLLRLAQRRPTWNAQAQVLPARSPCGLVLPPRRRRLDARSRTADAFGRRVAGPRARSSSAKSSSTAGPPARGRSSVTPPSVRARPPALARARHASLTQAFERDRAHPCRAQLGTGRCVSRLKRALVLVRTRFSDPRHFGCCGRAGEARA